MKHTLRLPYQSLCRIKVSAVTIVSSQLLPPKAPYHMLKRRRSYTLQN